MLYYILILSLTFLGCITYDTNNTHKHGRRALKLLIFISLTLLIGLRYKVGGDSIAYEMIFEDAHALTTWRYTWMHIYQPGFTFIEAIAKSIFTQFYVFQIIHAFIVNLALFIFINKNSRYFFISLLIIEFIVYLYFTTEILRETLAVLTFALSYPYYQKKKWGKYYLCVIIAMHFHISSIILAILPVFHNITFNRRYFYYIIGIGLAIPLARPILSLIPYAGFIEKYDSYSGNFYGVLFSFFSLLKGALFPLFFCLFIKFGVKKHLKFENILCIMILFGIASAYNPLIFGRSLNFFYLFLALSVAEYIGDSYKIFKTTAAIHNSLIIILILFCCYGTQYLHLHQYIRWIPYSSILNPVDYERDHTKFIK